MDDPRSAYSRLLDERRADIARREERHRTLGYLRLAVASTGVAIVWLALASRVISIAWVLGPIAMFTVLLVLHERLLRVQEHRRRAARYFERGLERLDGNWAGHGDGGQRYLKPEHPYAQDLDLFGQGSLFELLCTARTHIGEDTLARWLLAPAEVDTIRARQQATGELRPRLDLREDLAVVAEEARTGVDPVSLAEWGESPPKLEPGLHLRLWIFRIIGCAGLAAISALALNSASLLRLSDRLAVMLRDVFLLVLLANGWFLHRWRRVVERVPAEVEEAGHELGLLSEVLFRLERERFQSPLLAALRASLDTAGEPPSRRIARLNRLLERLDSRDNIFVRVAEIFVLWTPFLAWAVENWRRESGAGVRRWLTATGEMEALCSLASYSFENPLDPFPEFTGGPAGIDAESVGHPLIRADRVVRNDVRLGGAAAHVLVVSGSNMSGKSTLLRTLGINTVLAQAGAPVRARRMRLSRLSIGASIRLTDSLQGGVSRFYAEILRIRQVLDLTAGELPVLFLIDEFLHGTNSHDRRIGAEALVRGLVERGALGLITTHDLALADIAGALGERAANVHFEDRIEDGKILFDYIMRPGVVRKSNAIELMRSVGLEI